MVGKVAWFASGVVVGVVVTVGVLDCANSALVGVALAGIFVAVFEPKIHAYLRRPILRVDVEPVTLADRRRIRISNKEGRGPAEDVQVIALKLTRAKDGPDAPSVIDLPANLCWAAETSHKRTLPLLFHGSHWCCDVLHTQEHDGRLASCKLAVRGGAQDIEPGKYLLQLCVAARNCNAFEVRMRITFTKQQFATEQEMREEGCRLEKL